jgi:hypothetical protein
MERSIPGHVLPLCVSCIHRGDFAPRPGHPTGVCPIKSLEAVQGEPHCPVPILDDRFCFEKFEVSHD